MRRRKPGARKAADSLGGRFRPQLILAALLRRLVRPPAQEFGAVAEAAAGDMVVAHFGDQLGPQRLPFAGPLGAPAARPAGRIAGEARRRDQLLQLSGQRLLVLGRDRRGEADMIEPALLVIEAEQRSEEHTSDL